MCFGELTGTTVERGFSRARADVGPQVRRLCQWPKQAMMAARTRVMAMAMGGRMFVDFFFSDIVDIQYYFLFVSGRELSGQIFISFIKRFSPCHKYPPGTIYTYYNITDYIPYAVLHAWDGFLRDPIKRTYSWFLSRK